MCSLPLGKGCGVSCYLDVLFATLALVILILFSCASSAENAIRLDGNLDYEVYGEGQQLRLRQEFAFVVFYPMADTGEWRFDLTQGSNFIESIGCDGTNVFVTFQGQKIGARDPQPTATAEKEYKAPPLAASVCLDLYPSVASDHAKVLWIAFAAGKQLSDDIKLPPPWRSLKGGEQGRKLPIKFNLLEANSQMPSNLRFFYPQDLSEGAGPIAEYSVVRTSRLFGVALPKDFELRRYFGHNERATSKLLLKYSGRISGVNTASISSFRPVLEQPAGVFDRRFSYTIGGTGVQGIVYLITNGTWLGTNEPDLQKMYEQQKEHFLQSQTADRQPKGSKGILMILACVVLMPPVAYVFVLLRRRFREVKRSIIPNC